MVMRSLVCACSVSVCLCVYVSASVCAVHASTFESLYLETSFLHTNTSSECLRQIRMSRSLGQGQGHRSKNCIYERN